MKRFSHMCVGSTNPWAEIVDGELKVKQVEAVNIPDEVEEVKKLITSALPRVKLPDLLIEVDQWTHFTRHFTYFSGQESRTKDLQKCLFANFIGQGCNIGLVNMADSTPDITYRQLFHVSQWYLRDDTLRKAMAEIINFQHRLPLASVWGDGTKSTSDGMRLNVPVNAFGATFHPKYFGKYGRGVTRYSFLSDQFAEFYTIIIPSNLRESRIVNLVKELPNTIAGNRIGGQLLDAGTSVGANYEEAQAAKSFADFTYKMSTARKEYFQT